MNESYKELLVKRNRVCYPDRFCWIIDTSDRKYYMFPDYVRARRVGLFCVSVDRYRI